MLTQASHYYNFCCYAYLQPFPGFVTKVNDNPKNSSKCTLNDFRFFAKINDSLGNRWLLRAVCSFLTYFDYFEPHITPCYTEGFVMNEEILKGLWTSYNSLLYSLPFPIALKNCVLSAFRQNNAPQLRLYQNWGANMAKDCNFNTMHPFVTKRVHFSGYWAIVSELNGRKSLDDAEYAKEEFREKWNKKYPNILKSWDKSWSELTTFFEYPQEIRKIIYTTNAVESYHRMVRKFTKSKAIFPTDDSIRKIIYMSVKEISKKWTMPVRDWGLAYSQLAIFFEDRFRAWRLMRVPPSNSWGLSALGISSEDEEKQQHFCHCSSPFYSAACVGALLSVALFGLHL